jgi:short-subunit dehydrogenase
VITGAAGGLGRAIAMRLAVRGANLVLADIDTDGAEETRRMVESGGGKAHVTSCDVAKPGEVERLHDRATRELEYVDLLVNNAGVAVGGPVGTVPLTDWEWIMGINLWGVIYGCHHFLPAMKKRNTGHVLNVASIAAFASAAEMAPYNVTKAGVVALSETLASELAGTGVGVTVLCPYFFTTNIAKSARSSATMGTDGIQKLMSRNPVQANEVAERALLACDREALYAFPHKEAKTIALLKRGLPENFHRRLSPWLAKKMDRSKADGPS